MRLTILQGDIFERMRDIPDSSIDLCITSPPYWGLRSYGAGEAELGKEPTMEKYIDNTLRWVKEVYRILKPTGSFVLNIGDCFIGGGRGSEEIREKGKPKDEGMAGGQRGGVPSPKIRGGIYKVKQLLSVSSFAYCRIVSETDFVCRGEHIWAKPNVPSPIRSRLKHSHEKLFWFVKEADGYYFEPKAWMKPIGDQSIARQGRNSNTDGAFADNIGLSESTSFRRKPEKRSNDEQLRYLREKAKGTANLETSEEFRRKHEGTAFPTGSFHKYVQETIEHSWRVVPVGAKQNGFEMEDGKPQSEHVAPFPERLIAPYITSLCPQDGTILDPFLGSGTTMQVARTQNRDCIGIELNPKSIEYAKKRVCWGRGIGVEYAGEFAGSLKKEA